MCNNVKVIMALFSCSSDYVPPPTKVCVGVEGGVGGVGGEHIVFRTDPVGVGVNVGVKLLVCCNLNTLWNILMILGRNVDQDEMTCHIQDWQLWLSYFWSYHPLFCLKKISCPLCNSNTLWNISMVLGRNVEQDQTTCPIQEWQLCLSFGVISLCYIW